MLIYRNFTTSRNIDILNKYPDFVLVLEDEEGNDWYALQKNFKEDTLKILFNDENRVVSYSFDVSSLTPTNLSAAEIPQEKIPDDFFTNTTGYKFIDNEIKPVIHTYEEEVAIANSKKQTLLSEANSIIATLQDAVDLGMATDEEKAQLIAWKKYRVLLNRVDTSLALDIDWPEKP
ncbi:tail fiber assembly protein [Providencia rettgeri]|uniref:Caudovirales tail fibre assembly protein n=1 Tax=Providencia rettgeri TaxID=587 RepID=A0A379FT40_PRORE|nr:tail fiber assembly protein [Providencia rettgeri]QXB04708.1 tail fiber assembly protein [Providencia rettgeri]SUC31930.1 Caudovirales tail fibre assembly protein [Providencia rettgeri]